MLKRKISHVDKERLKEIANENISLILDSLHIDYADQGDYYNSCCPIHHGDNPTAFSYNHAIGVWRCFTRGCHEQYGSDAIGLVRGVRRCGFEDAIEFILGTLSDNGIKFEFGSGAGSSVGSSVGSNDYGTEYDISIRAKKIKRKMKYKKDPSEVIDDSIFFDGSGRFPDSLTERGLSSKIINRYGIRCFGKGWLGGYKNGTPYSRGRTWHGLSYSRIVIPVYNIDGKCVGWTARAVDGGKPKWLHSPFMSASFHLFNLNNAAKHILDSTSVVLCEGPFDVLKLEQCGVRNSVAVFGDSISQQQINLLMQSGTFTIYTCFDNDEAGNRATDRLISRYKNVFSFIDMSRFLPVGSDICDLSDDSVKEIVRNAFGI